MAITLASAEKQHYVPRIEEVISLATKLIDRYFADKTPDPSFDLYDTRFIRLVINSSIINDLPLVYDCIGIEFAGVKMRQRHRIDKITEMYRQCAVREIPKDFATGLILMEYIVCKGIDILDDE